MECLGGHTFPEQRRVTQLVINKTRMSTLTAHVLPYEVVLMAQWLRRASQGYDMYYHGLEV